MAVGPLGKDWGNIYHLDCDGLVWSFLKRTLFPFCQWTLGLWTNLHLETIWGFDVTLLLTISLYFKKWNKLSNTLTGCPSFSHRGWLAIAKNPCTSRYPGCYCHLAAHVPLMLKCHHLASAGAESYQAHWEQGDWFHRQSQPAEGRHRGLSPSAGAPSPLPHRGIPYYCLCEGGSSGDPWRKQR